MTRKAPSFGQRLRNWARRAPSLASEPALLPSVRSPGARLDSPMILARYEAGQMGGRNRSWLPAYVQDAQQDITPGERLEMVRKSRYFEKNNATEQKILDLIEVNVVGTGIHATPSADDPDAKTWTPEKLAEWNSKAQARWDEWCEYADLTSLQSFESLQALMVRAQAVDGEIFVWLTRGDPDENGRVFPRIQLIETHRVRDSKLPAQFALPEGWKLFDGIITDPRGRPAFYIVTNDADAFSRAEPRSIAILPAHEVVHIYEPSRTSQPRGIPLFHSVLHDLHDLDDLQQYEMLASKDAASRANVIKTASGELADQDGRIIGETETVTDANGETAERITYYQKAAGANTIVLKHGDELSQTTALRPTSAQQEFWKILERKVCRGTGISYAALCDYEGGWSGPALRGALTADNRFYDVRTKTLCTGLRRVYAHVLSFDVKPGGALFPAPRNWKKVTWQSPRRSTIDIGRESKAILEELRAGLRTEMGIQGEMGFDHNAQRRQRASEIRAWLKEAREIAKEEGIPVLSAYALLCGGTTVAQIPQAEASPAEDGPKPPARSGPGDEDEDEEIDIDEVRT